MRDLRKAVGRDALRRSLPCDRHHRGLLCRKCNTGLGCYEDDPATMITSLAYLGCGRRDRTGAAAQRALAARAALLPGRAGMAVRIDERSLNRLD